MSDYKRISLLKRKFEDEHPDKEVISIVIEGKNIRYELKEKK